MKASGATLSVILVHSHGTHQHLARMAGVADVAVGPLHNREFSQLCLVWGDLDAPQRRLIEHVAKTRKPRRHVGDYRAPAAEIDIVRLCTLKAATHRVHTGDILRHGEGGGVVR